MLPTCKYFFWLHGLTASGTMFYLDGWPGLAASLVMHAGWLAVFGCDLTEQPKGEDVCKGG